MLDFFGYRFINTMIGFQTDYRIKLKFVRALCIKVLVKIRKPGVCMYVVFLL